MRRDDMRPMHVNNRGGHSERWCNAVTKKRPVQQGLTFRSGGAGAFQDSGNGFGQDLEIQPEGPFVHILQV